MNIQPPQLIPFSKNGTDREISRGRETSCVLAEEKSGPETSASPDLPLLTTQKQMCPGKAFFFFLPPNLPSVAPEDRKTDHMAKSATSHRHRADLLSDGNTRLDPNLYLPSYTPASPHTHAFPKLHQELTTTSRPAVNSSNIYSHVYTYVKD